LARTIKERLPYSGYFLTFEPGRTTKIAESLYYPGDASESFSEMDWTFERREIALLSLTPSVPAFISVAWPLGISLVS